MSTSLLCFSFQPYPIRTENGHPTMAPAATPVMAKGVESWNHPVIATNVVYIQKEEGRKAEAREQQKKTMTEWISGVRVDGKHQRGLRWSNKADNIETET